MKLDIAQYINSGTLEAYIMGAATPAEEKEIRHLQSRYPEVKYALQQLENDFEHMARSMAVTPPPVIWNRIETEINELITGEQTLPQSLTDHRQHTYTRQNNGQQYIEVEAESGHMRVHKNWKWIFAAVFVLSKIFLICAIYFYLENRQAQQQLQQLQQEIRELRK